MSCLREHLKKMRHSGLRNYIVPGLDSYLLGGEGKGRVRLFTCSRRQQEFITPHSHRFDFACLVISGKVMNQIYEPATAVTGEAYTLTSLTRGESFGSYTRSRMTEKFYKPVPSVYNAGDEYFMRAEQIHSISFDEGTQVLFFEGPERLQASLILEPYVNGRTVQTFHVAPWMFEPMGEGQ
jgi:hypothetical protein